MTTLQEATHAASDARIGAGSDADVFARVLSDVVQALADVPFAVLGGVASAAYGRPRWTKDIDIFLRGDDADAALTALADADFETERTNPSWIFKGFRDGVMVDVIFKVKSDVYFDDEMAARTRIVDFADVAIPVVAPEDVIVTKAMAADEEAPWHWHDALGVIASTDLDWEYLLARACKSPNRVLSLLHYALSIDLPVSVNAIRSLHDSISSRWD